LGSGKEPFIPFNPNGESPGSPTYLGVHDSHMALGGCPNWHRLQHHLLLLLLLLLQLEQCRTLLLLLFLYLPLQLRLCQLIEQVNLVCSWLYTG
jgi:hypothetical protein